MIKIEKFFDDEKLQKKYEKRVHLLLKELKGLYKEFKETLHGELVKQLARSEMMALRYEKLVANDEESKTVVKLLANERTHLRQLYNQLMANVKEIRNDNNTVKFEIPTNFVEFLQIRLAEQIGDSEDDESAGKSSKNTG